MSELREKVARLMGWTDLRWVEAKHLGRVVLQGMNSNEPFRKYEQVVPEYERDIAAAWTVVQFFEKREFEVILFLDRNLSKVWRVSFSKNISTYDMDAVLNYEAAEATSAPEAICKAAIKLGTDL